eukprot:g11784.t1
MADELSKEEEKTDWYGVLSVDVGATEKDINKSFKKLSLVWHPDKNGGSEEAHAKFMKIKEAKLFLLDAKKRRLYDEKRAARHKTEALLAERNRTMGKRQRELRAELERREKEASDRAFSSPPGRRAGGGLGAGGEARVAAAKLDELRKKGEAERQRQSADWSVRSASAKKRSARSSGLPGTSTGTGDGDDDGLEERTIRVKWKTRKESHSDYTLDVLFSRFGAVRSVSIEEGKGDRALVVFATAASADAAMAAYGDRDGSETMRTSYVGKRRPKRSAFAPRRQTMSPTPSAWGGGGSGGGDRGAEGGRESLSSFRDHESVVMMNLRKEAERQALIRKMAEEEGLPVPVSGGGKKANAAAASVGGAAAAAVRTGTGAEPAAAAASTVGMTGGVEGVREGGDLPGGSSNPSKADPNKPSEKVDRDAAAEAPPTPAPAARNGAPVPSESAGTAGVASRDSRPAFPIPSPMTPRVMPTPTDFKSRRKSDVLLPGMMGGGSGGGAGFGGLTPAPPAVPAFVVGSKSLPTTPVSGRGAMGQAIDESDILARMMAMKR